MFFGDDQLIKRRISPAATLYYYAADESINPDNYPVIGASSQSPAQIVFLEFGSKGRSRDIVIWYINQKMFLPFFVKICNRFYVYSYIASGKDVRFGPKLLNMRFCHSGMQHAQ